jgi:hypothetical protein
VIEVEVFTFAGVYDMFLLEFKDLLQVSHFRAAAISHKGRLHMGDSVLLSGGNDFSRLTVDSSSTAKQTYY